MEIQLWSVRDSKNHHVKAALIGKLGSLSHAPQPILDAVMVEFTKAQKKPEENLNLISEIVKVWSKDQAWPPHFWQIYNTLLRRKSDSGVQKLTYTLPKSGSWPQETVDLMRQYVDEPRDILTTSTHYGVKAVNDALIKLSQISPNAQCAGSLLGNTKLKELSE